MAVPADDDAAFVEELLLLLGDVDDSLFSDDASPPPKASRRLDSTGRRRRTLTSLRRQVQQLSEQLETLRARARRDHPYAASRERAMTELHRRRLAEHERETLVELHRKQSQFLFGLHAACAMAPRLAVIPRLACAGRMHLSESSHSIGQLSWEVLLGQGIVYMVSQWCSTGSWVPGNGGVPLVGENARSLSSDAGLRSASLRPTDSIRWDWVLLHGCGLFRVGDD